VPVPHKPKRAETRVMRLVNQLVTAATGRDALTASMNWALSEITRLERRDPQAAEDARWHLTRGIASWSAGAPRSRFEHRAGITEDEKRELLR